MKWNHDLPDQIEERLKQVLPGQEAHLKALPFNRTTAKQVIEQKLEYRESAVCVLLYPKDEAWHLVLMRRPEYDGAHSGQISFPGGKREPEDKDLSATALRELEEESGVPVNQVQLIGQMTELYIPPSGFLVYPYVGVLNHAPAFNPDPVEVAELIEVPLSLFLDDSIIKTKKMLFKKHQIEFETPYFDVFGHVVWGATCAMLYEFKELLLELNVASH